MISPILDTLNARLQLLTYFEKTYCLTELKTEVKGDNEITSPVHYVGSENWEKIEVDKHKGVSYWRKDGQVTVTEEEDFASAKDLYTVTFPLKLVAYVKRKDTTTDDEYSPDRIANALVKQLSFKNGALKQTLKARRVISSVTDYSTDSQEIWSEETDGAEKIDVPFKYAVVSLSVEVNVLATIDCIETECEQDEDILHAFDFCDPNIQARLTSGQQTCLTDWLCGTSDPATLNVNGSELTTIPSGDTYDLDIHNTDGTDVGTVANPSIVADSTNEVNGVDISDPTVAEGTHNQQIQNSDSTPIGTAANPSIIADSQAQVNGVNTETIPAETTHDQSIHNSAGADVGTAANPSVVSDATITINGASLGATGSVVAEGSLDIDVNLNGSPSGSWDGDSWEVTSDPVPTVSVGAYSDAGFTNPITIADIGDTIYLKAVPTDITPVLYRFEFECADGIPQLIYEGPNDNTSWVVSGADGDGRMFAFATEDANEPADWVGNSIEFEATGFAGLLDAYPNNNVFAASFMSLRFDHTDPLGKVRRTSDNDTGDFSRDNSVSPVRLTEDSILSNGVPSSNDGDTLAVFTSGTDGVVPVLRDQTTNANDAAMLTAAQQPEIVSSGTLNEDGSRPYIFCDFANSQKFNLWTAGSPAPAVYQTLDDSISFVAWVSPSAFGSGVSAKWFSENVLIEILSSGLKVPISVGFDSTGKVKVGVAINTGSGWDAFLSTTVCSTSTYYKIIVTIDSNTVKIYIDGVLDSTHTITRATSARAIGSGNAYGNIFGRANNDELTFNGDAKTIALFDTVFDQTDVTDITNNYLT